MISAAVPVISNIISFSPSNFSTHLVARVTTSASCTCTSTNQSLPRTYLCLLTSRRYDPWPLTFGILQYLILLLIVDLHVNLRRCNWWCEMVHDLPTCLPYMQYFSSANTENHDLSCKITIKNSCSLLYLNLSSWMSLKLWVYITLCGSGNKQPQKNWLTDLIFQKFVTPIQQFLLPECKAPQKKLLCALSQPTVKCEKTGSGFFFFFFLFYVRFGRRIC